MRGVRLCWVGFAALALLAGCGRGWFAEREPWRREAEEQCLKSGAVKQSAAVTMLRPIDGPGMCGADFPLKVAALGEGNSLLGYADDLRPPGSIPMAAPPRSAPYTPSYSRARAPLDPSMRFDARGTNNDVPSRDYQQGAPGDPDFIEDDPDDDSVRQEPAPSRDGVRSRNYTPRNNAPGAVTSAPLSTAPFTTAPAPSPRAYPQPVPLGRQRPLVQTTAAVTPAATLACPIVSALDRWITDSVQPAAMRWFNEPVTEIRQISAYSCRGMNGQPGAHISEHAFGNALDIAAFTLADGRQVTVKNGWRGLPEEQGFLRDIQAAACAQFTTVLAPGSNAYHYDHIHVDLMRRLSGRVICEPAATSGAEVAARAARNGNALAQPQLPFDARNDPFAWRGPTRGRDGIPTGSIAQSANRASTRGQSYIPIDDEDVLDER